jgi:dienelactone hydrolase
VCVIGFYLGGGFALAIGKAFRATSTNYGALPAVEVMRGIGPTVACYDTRDRVYRNHGKAPAARLRVLDVPHEIHAFEAGHALLADGSHPTFEALSRPMLEVDTARDAAVREEAWVKILAFFERYASSSP